MRMHEKEYYLMHKDIPVCLMEISDDGALRSVRRNAAAAEHFPVGGQMNDMKFHDWWQNRAIPRTRHGAATALQRLGYSSTGSALVNNLALSLSDCYWIRPRGEDLAWADVNLFSNDFVDAFGEITMNQNHELDIRKDTRFDCATSQGDLQKKWCIDDKGRRCIIKGNTGTSYQQSLNEVIASRLHEQQGFRQYTPYSLVHLQMNNGVEGIGCLSYDYCNEHVESISAWELLQTVKTRQRESYYPPFKAACMAIGMSEEMFTAFMDYEIMTDYLITNTDRHMNNIAILRNPDSLEILGFAPIYDSGNSMFYNVPLEMLAAVDIDDIRTHSFVERENRLLQYVQDRSVVDSDRIAVDWTIYEQDIAEQHARIPELQRLFACKCERLRAFQSGKDIWKRQY